MSGFFGMGLFEIIAILVVLALIVAGLVLFTSRRSPKDDERS